jgi:hypothetical protein
VPAIHIKAQLKQTYYDVRFDVILMVGFIKAMQLEWNGCLLDKVEQGLPAG